ncbi:MAG: type 1 glutamine amidotransferase domain-containing protein [Ignavibacteriaceae bacterium]
MKLEGKKIAIFIEKMYEDVEFLYPYYRMKEEGAEVTVIAPEIDTFSGKHGVPVKADKSINDVNPKSFDALIIPGGFSPDHMRRSPAMIDFVKIMFDQQKPVAAICHAPWMLASAGILNGKKATSFFSIKDDIVNAGADWQDKEVVIDGNIITSRNPGDLPAFCRTIIESLVNKHAEVEA